MKVIKLNNKYRLGRLGYNYAFRFPSGADSNYYKVARMVSEAEGWRWDHTFIGKPDRYGRRIAYVGFRNESVATLVQLQL